jgi:hypothetical protein
VMHACWFQENGHFVCMNVCMSNCYVSACGVVCPSTTKCLIDSKPIVTGLGGTTDNGMDDMDAMDAMDVVVFKASACAAPTPVAPMAVDIGMCRNGTEETGV